MFTLDLEKLKKVNWYRQGGAMKLFYGFVPYHSISETIGYDRNILYQKGDISTAFFGKDEERAKALWVLGKQKNNIHFIDYWIREWRRRMDRTLLYCEQSFREPVAVWSDQKLVRFLHKVNRLILHYWLKGILIEWFDPEGEQLLQQEIKKSGVVISSNALSVLTGPVSLTFVQEEFIARIAIARALQCGKNIDRALDRHVREYHWYQDNWAYAHERDRKHFLALLRRDIKNLPYEMHEVRALSARLRKVKEDRKRLRTSLRIPSELANILYFFSALTDWRDERKKNSVCIINRYLHEILKRFMRENHLREQIAGQLLHTQITGWKLSRLVIAEAKQRNRGAIYFCNAARECRWFYGKKAQHLFDALIGTIAKGEVKGITAQKGKATGRVRIIETQHDFSKMRNGDVLVATMTRPEYMPLMKKAGAIVTNEGGVTCHAAIVSRELGIPCIIGTQVATEVFRDGDLVMVDADRGIIIKK